MPPRRTFECNETGKWRDANTQQAGVLFWSAGKKEATRHKQQRANRRISRGAHDAGREHGLARVDPVVLVAVVAVAEEAAGGVEATALGGEVRPVPALVPLAELMLRSNGTRQC